MDLILNYFYILTAFLRLREGLTVPGLFLSLQIRCYL